MHNHNINHNMFVQLQEKHGKNVLINVNSISSVIDNPSTEDIVVYVDDKEYRFLMTLQEFKDVAKIIPSN